jgi:hypothetical protein
MKPDVHIDKGTTFNESTTFRDTATGRITRKLTSKGAFNSTPTYHYNTAFTEDSRYMVFATARNGQSAIVRAELETGELTVLAETQGFGRFGHGGHRQPFAAGPHGGGFSGTGTALMPRSGWVLATTDRHLIAVHIETLEEKVLIDDIGPEYMLRCPCGNHDGTKAYIPVGPEHPDVVAGDPMPERSFKEAIIDEFDGCPISILEIDIETGDKREIYSDPIAGCAHVQPSPCNPDLVLINRNLPPTFGYYGDMCESPRTHILNLSSGDLTPCRPQNEHQFQSHMNWNRSGDRIYYHGPAKEGHEQPVYEGGELGEMFIGVADTSGESLWEMNMPRYYYGHVSTHTTEEAIITDALVSDDLVTVLHYQETDKNGRPRIEVLARHETDWSAMPGQYPHPHCHMSPDGRWLSYNRAHNGRSDVFVVECNH